ncbi:hypothetical protein, partial [Acinetobacter calcoaceticus]|uniref:hypothetical protein n=1 Tax=Acinetobacter calcoaceticus TaxID=471 RepID=UPI001D0E13B9
CISRHALLMLKKLIRLKNRNFSIATKTRQYVCYNSADNSMNETLFVPSINSDKEFRVNHVGTFIWW